MADKHEMIGLKKVVWLIIIGMYVHVCIWISYIMPMMSKPSPDQTVDILDGDELVFAYVVRIIFFLLQIINSS